MIAPLLTVAVNAGGEHYRGTAAAFMTVARMVGMTLGLAALAAWGMGYFQFLTAELSLPFQAWGRARRPSQERLTTYQANVSGASLDVFAAFFRVGAGLSLAAAVPALWMYEKRRS